MAVKIRIFPAGYLQTNAFLLSDPERGEATLIDAPHFVLDAVQPVLEEENCKLIALLLTHGHYDHIGDAARIARMKIPLYGHVSDRDLFASPERMRAYAYPPDIKLEGFAIDQWVEDSQTFEILGMTCETRHVPGHCPGNVLFYFEALKAAFVGDALFAGSIGRTDLPGGDFHELERSIQERIYTLPKETLVLAGHGPTTTVGEEMSNNPYVSGE